MTRYYFDLRKEDDLVPDEEGVELSTIEAEQAEAACSLAEMAKVAVRMTRGEKDHRMMVEVRDDHGLVLDVKYTFVVNRSAHYAG